MALTYVICDLTIFFTIQDFDRILFKPSNATWKLGWIPWHIPLLHIKNSLSKLKALTISKGYWGLISTHILTRCLYLALESHLTGGCLSCQTRFDTGPQRAHMQGKHALVGCSGGTRWNYEITMITILIDFTFKIY